MSSIEYTKVDSATRPAFYETLLAFWDRRWDDKFEQEFLDWRYARRSQGETLIALAGSKCIGLIDTFIRPYRVGGQSVVMREPCDWYCLPGNRGVGMRLMKLLMSQDEALIGVGLPKGAIAIAPRLKWRHLLDTHDFVLPISARRLAAAILRKAKLGDGSVTRHLPRGIPLHPASAWARYRDVEGDVEELAPADWPEEDGNDVPANGAYAVTPVATRSYVQWLASAPAALGQVFCLAFRVKGTIVGLTICRVESSKVGRKARLIHLQSSESDMGRLQWMVAENVRRASRLEAESLHFRSSCPATNGALASLGFYHSASHAVMTFKTPEVPSGPANITFLRGDDAMIPSLIAE